MLRANINLDRHLLLIRRPSARIKRRCALDPGAATCKLYALEILVSFDMLRTVSLPIELQRQIRQRLSR